VHDRARLIESDVAAGVDAGREDQQAADGRLALDDSAVVRQNDVLASQRVDEARSATGRSERVGDRGPAVGSEVMGELTREALGVVDGEVRLVHGQLDTIRRGGDGREVVVHLDVVADVLGDDRADPQYV